MAAEDKHALEEGLEFTPRFDAAGLIPVIASDADGGGVLMFAFANAAALQATLDTGEAHFWSRSRNKIWRKGEESGNVLDVVDMRTDCDQDVLWLTVRVRGGGVACHTGRKSCFYRRLVRRDDGSWGLALDAPHT